MYSIKDNVENTILIKKSKFITKLFKVNNIKEIEDLIEKANNDFCDANHVCFAYSFSGLEKCSDNGEPNGTAGLPMLNVLKKKNLSNILAIVIRYFGGIKLGAGGLVRAYSNSVTEALKLTSEIELVEGFLVELEFSHSQIKLIDYILNEKEIIKKEYNDNVIYSFYLNQEELNFIPKLEKVAIHISIKDKVLIEKRG